MDEVHKSWLNLSATVSEEIIQESFEEYYSRIQKMECFSNIPKVVFSQWIYMHHHKNFSKKHYGWIDYEKVRFKLCELETDKLVKLHTLEAHDSYKCLAEIKDFKNFSCKKKYIRYWKEHGTWKTPPVVLDVKSFSSVIPTWAEVFGEYHLIEGYTRLGYLLAVKAMAVEGKTIIAPKHKVFLMSKI